MAAGGWTPIEPSGPDEGPRAAGAAPPPPPTGPPRRGHRRWWLAGTVTLAALLVAGAVTVASTVGGGRAGDSADAAHRDGAGASGGSPAEGGLTARQAFTQGRLQLERGGSFAYSGTVHAERPDLFRPARRLPDQVDVEGRVRLPRRVHEVAHDAAGRGFETVTIGPGVWERSSSASGGLSTAEFALTVRHRELTQGAVLLPTWFSETEDAEALGADPDGVQHFRATLPRPDAGGRYEVLLDLDADGGLKHVAIADPDAAFAVDWEISHIGEPVDIAAPGGRSVGIDPQIDAADLAAAGLGGAVEVTAVPDGWVLSDAWIEPDHPRAGCSTLHLDYQPVDRLDDYLDDNSYFLVTEVVADGCAVPFTSRDARDVTVGDFSGLAADEGMRDIVPPSGQLSDGTTTVSFRTSMTLDDALAVLETLAPFDPTRQPGMLDLPSARLAEPA
jgi:hypothetical protein